MIKPETQPLQAIERIRASEEYGVQYAMLEFSEAVIRRMAELGLSKADLAKRMGKSKAYVTKVLRGDANLTVRTQIALCRALGGYLKAQLVSDRDYSVGENMYWNTFSSKSVADHDQIQEALQMLVEACVQRAEKKADKLMSEAWSVEQSGVWGYLQSVNELDEAPPTRKPTKDAAKRDEANRVNGLFEQQYG